MRDSWSQIVGSGFAGVLLLAMGVVVAGFSLPDETGLGVGSAGGVWLGAVTGSVGAVLLSFSVTAYAVTVGIRASHDRDRRRG